ncbi:TPA: peptide-methionine (R)-S-oxide reductase MsrB [Pasteurella multocida]|uniref:peptide-methionine (R)-S-oxide reductase MsrB n=1 Tax=Pasteurella multocida TaxID=747 RepID=UPI000233FAC8|nr:peptide-methionine (R)-S-oxide reductase MsrB [Pasteurella multocida]AWW59201.1 peptide-methionine (R)-S-oxide reductase [Pasteurellaceae bacterium 12591]AET15197.1 peptide methionine sulfoxide reductase MsrB [Pasteurella multocida 36950]AHE63707.1 peptide methionine sulfoxide reductase MsrB [Pasteurella multocida subsp. multocida str. HB03]AIN48468.1 peptide methionine sulfoxide reductase MsrB [Pasteurella multocida]ANJ89538.1 peptide methionine sulfoxide reductase MsrB [Pasteurella multoc
MKKREDMTEMQVHVCLNQGTEYPFTGKLLDQQKKGLYRCVVCHSLLFVSDTKFDAGCGWPSFFQAISPEAIRYLDDYTLSRPRTEIRCGQCDAHLGHVFEDGPPPTGLRYCVNSVSMAFEDSETGELIEG